MVHPHEPDTIFVFPIGGGDGRYPPGGKARVWRSRDAGETWTELGKGLPDSFYVAVMRDAMSMDGHDSPGIYFGARNGTVWGSTDAGESWSLRGGRPARRDGGPGSRCLSQARDGSGGDRAGTRPRRETSQVCSAPHQQV